MNKMFWSPRLHLLNNMCGEKKTPQLCVLVACVSIVYALCKWSKKTGCSCRKVLRSLQLWICGDNVKINVRRSKRVNMKLPQSLCVCVLVLCMTRMCCYASDVKNKVVRWEKVHVRCGGCLVFPIKCKTKHLQSWEVVIKWKNKCQNVFIFSCVHHSFFPKTSLFAAIERFWRKWTMFGFPQPKVVLQLTTATPSQVRTKDLE